MNMKALIKRAPVCFSFTVLAAMFFLYQIYFVARYMRQVPWIYLLVCAIPLVFFGGVFVLRGHEKVKKNMALAMNISFPIFLVAVTICNVILGAVYCFGDGPIEETTDASQYPYILWVYGYPSKSMCQFPKKIPKEAKNVVLWENPQFLQGGSRVYVMYETKPEEIQSYRRKYEPLAKVVLPAGEEKASYQDYYIPTNTVMEGRELTDDFEVIILDGTPSQNHGYTTGLALNEITNEIFIFRENW